MTDTSVTLSIVGRSGLSVWSLKETSVPDKTKAQVQLCLQPGSIAVIGKQQGGHIEYLDSRYVPTPLLPDSSGSILTLSEMDQYVSRGHFMLKRTSLGTVLVNGVPRKGGGIRPPTNGTFLLQPENRWLEKGEEYLIEGPVLLILPNRAVVLICTPHEGLGIT